MLMMKMTCHMSYNVSVLFPLIGKAIMSFTYFSLSTKEKFQTHHHVLTNCPQTDPFLQ